MKINSAYLKKVLAKQIEKGNRPQNLIPDLRGNQNLDFSEEGPIIRVKSQGGGNLIIEDCHPNPENKKDPMFLTEAHYLEIIKEITTENLRKTSKEEINLEKGELTEETFTDEEDERMLLERRFMSKNERIAEILEEAANYHADHEKFLKEKKIKLNPDLDEEEITKMTYEGEIGDHNLFKIFLRKAVIEMRNSKVIIPTKVQTQKALENLTPSDQINLQKDLKIPGFKEGEYQIETGGKLKIQRNEEIKAGQGISDSLFQISYKEEINQMVTSFSKKTLQEMVNESLKKKLEVV